MGYRVTLFAFSRFEFDTIPTIQARHTHIHIHTWRQHIPR